MRLGHSLLDAFSHIPIMHHGLSLQLTSPSMILLHENGCRTARAIGHQTMDDISCRTMILAMTCEQGAEQVVAEMKGGRAGETEDGSQALVQLLKVAIACLANRA